MARATLALYIFICYYYAKPYQLPIYTHVTHSLISSSSKCVHESSCRVQYKGGRKGKYDEKA